MSKDIRLRVHFLNLRSREGMPVRFLRAQYLSPTVGETEWTESCPGRQRARHRLLHDRLRQLLSNEAVHTICQGKANVGQKPD